MKPSPARWRNYEKEKKEAKDVIPPRWGAGEEVKTFRVSPFRLEFGIEISQSFL